ncbi:methyltransferase domain-containing protein [Limibaculum sp. M0105]|uniref:Methyltransferase domain-containing protein n=1 Tax=Thermohalobaculum xanthum TaxID=2753746 RepID=A0A8J7SFV5_9RHOB|nr:methyltransferase domain-containing protein [Thermohalobaculum xanthum]MBK0399777.1 methyltransferase domain-containing protein [Thermohalobaculum xanthum]
MAYEEFGAREAQGWAATGLVEQYVSKFARATRMAVGPMVEAVGAGRGRSVLDLCCGQGTGSAALAATGADVTGLDFSSVMIERAREAAPAARFVEGDAQDLPFESSSFDGAICGFGLMHVPDQDRALAEVRRVLRPGARFAMAAWHGPATSPAFRIAFGAMKAHGDMDAAPPAPDFFAFADPSFAEQHMLAAGFSAVRSERVECCFEFDEPGGLWEIFSRATVRAAMILDAQTPGNRAAIRDAVTQAVREGYADGAGYKVPAPAALVVANV